MGKIYGIVFLALACTGLCCGKDTSDDVTEKLVERIEKLENKNIALERKVTEQQAQIDGQSLLLEEVAKSYDGKTHNHERDDKRLVLATEPPIAFTARIDVYNIDHVKHMDIIKFPKIITNIGGAYNPASGIFVAPISGIYVFSCSLLDSEARSDGSGVMLHAEIVQDHTVLGRIFAHAQSTTYRDQGAQIVFSQVTMGEQVWVRNIDNNDLSLGGDLYSTFSGYLLWPTS